DRSASSRRDRCDRHVVGARPPGAAAPAGRRLRADGDRDALGAHARPPRARGGPMIDPAEVIEEVRQYAAKHNRAVPMAPRAVIELATLAQRGLAPAVFVVM